MRIVLYSEVMSPLTHAAGTVGNESVIKRERTASGYYVPTISGNALRHRVVREPGARYLVEALELEGKLTLPQLAFLFNGGALTESTGSENTKRIADMHRLLPLLRLLGGSLPDQILSGILVCHAGTLVCEENRERLEHLLPDEWSLPKERLRNAETLVDNYQYTRGVPTKSAAQFVRESTEEIVRGQARDGKSNQMIFAGQCVVPGAAFVHGFIAPSASDLDIGCLLNSIDDWQRCGGTVGGASGRGHGQLNTYVHGVDGDPVELIAKYREYVNENKQECVDWLMSAFADKAEKKAEKKGKK